MKCILPVFVMALVLMIVGCSGSGDLPVAEFELTETQERFKTKTTFEDGVLSIEARRQDGSPRVLTTAKNVEFEWGVYLPPPPIPGFVSREWLLSENRHDGRTLLYTAASWDDDNPADYLAVGWWLHYPLGAHIREFEAAERGVFIDGPELDLANPPNLPVSGEATYVGGIGGPYAYRYGGGWGELQGEQQYVEFSARIGLTANFSDATVAGCIGCEGDIEVDALHLWPIVTSRTPDPVAMPTDYEVRFGPIPFQSNGTFETTTITVTHLERTVTRAEGSLSGQFSNVPDPDGHPRRVVGLSDVRFDEADGSSGSLMGIFSALTPAATRPEESETP